MAEYFNTRKIDNVTAIRFLFSELSLVEAEDLKPKLYGLISDADKRFVINMEGCLFMSSVTLGIIVNFAAKIHARRGRLVFCSLRKEVDSVFKITKLKKILEIYKTEEDALASFK